jgi:hypothetical protein
VTDEYPLDICTDCLMLVANDDTTALDDLEADRLRNNVADRWPSSRWLIVPGDDYGAFSRKPCDGCGSTLGGDRVGATAYPKEHRHD